MRQVSSETEIADYNSSEGKLIPEVIYAG